MEVKRNEFYSIAETAEILKVTTQSLRNMMSQNKPVPKRFRFGKRVLFKGSDILYFAEERRGD